MDAFYHKETGQVFWPEPEDVRGTFYKVTSNQHTIVVHATKDNVRSRVAEVLGVSVSELNDWPPADNGVEAVG